MSPPSPVLPLHSPPCMAATASTALRAVGGSLQFQHVAIKFHSKTFVRATLTTMNGLETQKLNTLQWGAKGKHMRGEAGSCQQPGLLNQLIVFFESTIIISAGFPLCWFPTLWKLSKSVLTLVKFAPRLQKFLLQLVKLVITILHAPFCTFSSSLSFLSNSLSNSSQTFLL